ncbi:hypothetical protein GTY81_09065 [Streptomyces sp. SID8366]|uniref:hypothetical protein n=1 Tax=unclassified Streptomyces TaxID=2593676 RepID=UPI000DC34BBF|nr:MULTISPECIES: hypothetical protein [unclassified Streptomyces]MYU04035.1 hypothetical protein [Streptomyces sp. SID8366]MYU65129.1 hypothetical protein [Streptomyces sp. SID69]RAJ54314.1 hypothetical protein K376_05280 [Streptomyces sp. PsTaAH-130]
MNLDFSAEPLFSWYVVLLFISGAAMLILGVVNAGGLSKGWRAFNVIAGLGFMGYGIYLGFIFQGGSYLIFFKAFILPVMVVVNFFRSRSHRKAMAAQKPMGAPQPMPAPYPMAGQPPMGAPAPQPMGAPQSMPAPYPMAGQQPMGAPAPQPAPAPERTV